MDDMDWVSLPDEVGTETDQQRTFDTSLSSNVTGQPLTESSELDATLRGQFDMIMGGNWDQTMPT